MAHWNDPALRRRLPHQEVVGKSDSKNWTMKYIKTHLWQTLVIISIISFGLIRSIYIAEPDILWQAKSGMDLLADGIFVRPDSYSWTASGTEYISNSWLWNVITAVVYETGGFLGIAICTGILTSIIFSLLAYTLRRYSVSWPAVFFALSALALFSGFWFTGRPQIADYLLLSAVLAGFSKAKLTKRIHHIYAVLALTLTIVLWNNLHLTGMVGSVCFAAIYFLKQVESQSSVRWKTMIAPALRSLGALSIFMVSCLLTPYGVAGLVKPLVTASASTGVITEWISPWTFYEYINTISAVAIVVTVSVIAVRFRTIHWLDTAYVIGLLAVASWQSRWVPFATVLLIVMVGKSLDSIRRKYHFANSVYVKSAALALVSTLMVAGCATFIPQDRVSNAKYGFSLVNSVPAGCKVFNEAAMGGPLVLMRPDIKVSLDGRNDMYGPDEYIEQNSVAHNLVDAAKWLQGNRINCILLHEDSQLNSYLTSSSEWRLTDEDSSGAKLWVRDVPLS